MRDHLGETLSAFIDGTLDARGVAEVEAHLHACAACRAEAAALRATLTDLGSLARPVLAETDLARLRIGLEKARRRGGGPWNKMTAVAAAFVLIAGGTIALTRGGSDPSRDRSATLAAAPTDVQDVDYAEDSARSLLTETAAQKSAMESAPAVGALPATGLAESGAGNADAAEAVDHTARIAECEATFLGDDNVIRERRIVARYQGEPAYLLTYRVPADKPTHLELWVLGIDDCGVRFFAEEKL